jgi:hypothetical protein
MSAGDKLIGNRFGKLVVLGEYEPSRQAINNLNHYSARVYASVLCQCDCGNTKRIPVHDLRKGSTKSCGCFRSENSSKMWKELGKIGGRKRRKYSTKESSARDLFQKYLKRHPGDLTFEEFYKLTQLECHHCGANPHQIYLVKNATDDDKTSQFIYNGLDRVDISRGYDKDNVVPCCGTCNFMRHKLSLSDFYMHITKIVKHRGWDLPKHG